MSKFLQFALALASILVLTSALAMAQESNPKIKKAPIPMTSPSSGEEMFNTYCAVCHGKGGKGDGPASSEFKIPPANLTLLAKNHDGKYPESYVAQVIQNGPRDAKAHGSKDMPVWGQLFSALQSGSTVKLRIFNLNKYIETLQAK
jgi:mono/diheme cytochrome c family protein